MTVDPRTPVIVGAAAATQRLEGSDLGMEPVELMVAAARQAAGPSGALLLESVDTVIVPRGTWRYADAGRLVARRVGAPDARSVCAEIGVLQTTLFSWSVGEIRAGRAEVVLICGGEARWRDVVAAREARPGAEGPTTTPRTDGPTTTPRTDGPTVAPWTDDAGGQPDTSLQAASAIVSPAEIAAGLIDAPSHYALLENAYRGDRGLSLEEHLAGLAERWSAFNAVAAANPAAWVRDRWRADELLTGERGNRMISFPYRKWHVSQWNVDQAAAVLVCSAGAAARAGVAPDRQVFIQAVAESNYMLPVSRRPSLAASPGFRWAGQAALAGAGLDPDGLDHVDLYSCFPVAVNVQARELGLEDGRPLTVTGGMTWAGGPLNNYVLQSAAAMYEILLEHPEDHGLLTAVSGMLTKQGVMIWSGQPPVGGVAVADVSGRVESTTEPVAVRDRAEGAAGVLTYTVTHGRDGSGRAVVLAELPGRNRCFSVCADAAVVAAMESEEWLGRSVVLDGQGGFRPA